MDETETTAAAPDKGAANHQPRQPRPAKPAQPAAKAEPCEDCGPGKGTAGAGILLCAVGGALLFVGLDLVSGGALARRLGGAREEDE